MTVHEIPTGDTLSDALDFYERVELDGVLFELRCHWNASAAGWFLDLRDEDSTPLVQGIRIVVDRLLLDGRRHLAGLPPGELIAFDRTMRQEDPGERDLG